MVKMHQVDGLKPREIAKVLRCSAQDVYSAVKHYQTRLQRLADKENTVYPVGYKQKV